ncbi:MAG: Rne/Rng family ribonuclease [Candidatus Gastranaerophilales bacterium]|nr:Rne/Rng family ribonuclease [Candidatus Gastranaerophilales bacterium]
MTKQIVIAERDNIAALIENGKVTEFFVNKGEIFLNDIYLSTVENILPSIEAAFVNVGSDKMGFLHADDVPGKGNLKNRLNPKQKLMVQVVKEPTGHKGPRVTTDISLPGRFLVLIPQETGINVSRKITSAKERARLKSTVSLIKPVGIGVIVRTEAEGQSESDIQEDLELLLEKWNTIITSAETQEAPSLLYRDQDLLYRVIREACTEDVAEIVVDTPFAMQRTQQILQNWNMLKNVKLTVYKGTEPLLQASGVMKEIKAALQVKVMLPSGGYLFIQTTEALSVVDVNSGKFVSSATQDETILKTNIEAVHEIARQLRLRNIGGMIIIDFIDMTNRNDKLAVMEEFELALENDKAKPQIGQLSDLGLVELTRHRQGQSLSEVFTKKCPHCQGTGYIFEDIQYASAPGEGELKAKAAKLKVPVQQLKNKNNINNNVFTTKTNDEPDTAVQNQEVQNEYEPEIPQAPAVENPETVNENVNNYQNNNNHNNHNKFNKNNRFNKNKNRFNNKFNRNNNYQNNNNENRQEHSDNDGNSANQENKQPENRFEQSDNKPQHQEVNKTEKVAQNHEISENNNADAVKADEPVKETKRRGRKPKTKTADSAETDNQIKEAPKKRGRKPKAKAE